MLDARLRLLAQPERPLQHNTEVSLHTGSAEVMARVRLLEKEEVQPGETTWVQFILEEPLAAVNGDHYVIRSPMDTLGGGIIVEAHPKERHRRFRPETIENLKARGEGKTEEILLAALKAKQPQELAGFLSQSNLAPDVARSAVESLIQQGKIVAAWGRQKQPAFHGFRLGADSGQYCLRWSRITTANFLSGWAYPKPKSAAKSSWGPHFPEVLQKLIQRRRAG